MTSVTPQPVRSVDEIRAAFPALARTHHGIPVAFFDGPGGTQVPRPVAEAMVDYLYHHNANTHWEYPTSRETDAMLLAARESCGDFLGVPADEIVFGPNMTTLSFHVARGLSRAWGPGDEVVVTELDHHANVAPWHTLVQERGITLRTVAMRPSDGTLDWGAFASAVGARTKLIAVGAASNALGTINDMSRARSLATAVDALLFVDAVHFAPHAIVERDTLGADLLVCSPYKFYGPHLGILTGRRALLEEIDVPRLEPAPPYAPDRLETGTQSHESIVGAQAGIDWLASLVPACREGRREALCQVQKELHRRGEILLDQLWTGLDAIPGIHLYGPPPGHPRTPTAGFVLDGVTAESVSDQLAEKGVFVSHGDFYAATVIERLGVGPSGLVRAGCACYTTAEEVTRLLDGVSAISQRRSSTQALGPKADSHSHPANTLGDPTGDQSSLQQPR